jgi:hypothetical protein
MYKHACGSQIRFDTVFCPGCGERLKTAPARTSAQQRQLLEQAIERQGLRDVFIIFRGQRWEDDTFAGHFAALDRAGKPVNFGLAEYAGKDVDGKDSFLVRW